MAVAEGIALLEEATAGFTDAACAWADATAAAAAAMPAGVK